MKYFGKAGCDRDTTPQLGKCAIGLSNLVQLMLRLVIALVTFTWHVRIWEPWGSLLSSAVFLIFRENRPWRPAEHLCRLFFIEERHEKRERTTPVVSFLDVCYWNAAVHGLVAIKSGSLRSFVCDILLCHTYLPPVVHDHSFVTLWLQTLSSLNRSQQSAWSQPSQLCGSCCDQLITTSVKVMIKLDQVDACQRLKMGSLD